MFKSKTYKKYITRHAKQRFQERHGVVFTNEQAKYIIKNILNNKAQFVSARYRASEEWIVEYKDKKYRVIFSVANKVIEYLKRRFKNIK